MPIRDTASVQLERILYLLPAAARESGARFSELEEALGTSTEQIVRDITQVTDRAFYHAAGDASETQILIEADRVQMLARGEFRRPPRLSTAEALALGIGLRSLACECVDDFARRARLLDLAVRLERQLAMAPIESDLDLLADIGPDAEGVRTALRDAARERRRCRLRYLKPEEPTPEERIVQPYALIFAERWWYLVGHCTARGEVRRFRLDRVLSVDILDGSFELPSDFDPRTQVDSGRVFVAEETVEVRVRYSPRIAPWILERTPAAEIEPDGSVCLRHEVADPQWVVRHVLQYGRDAQVLSPSPVRELVGITLASMLQGE